MRPRVTRVVTWQGECSRCGQVRSTHPLQTSTGEGAARAREREDTEDPWYLDQWRELFGEVLETGQEQAPILTNGKPPG